MLDSRRRTGQLPAGRQASADEAELHWMYGERLVQLHGCDKGRADEAAALHRPWQCSVWLL